MGAVILMLVFINLLSIGGVIIDKREEKKHDR